LREGGREREREREREKRERISSKHRELINASKVLF